MKKKSGYVLLFLCLLLSTCNVYATRGCCSHHGGVAGCASNGRQVCADGTYSPSCTCTPQYVYGCTDINAKNYNSSANKNDGSCVYDVKGCTNKDAINYSSDANVDDGTCQFKKTVIEQVEIPYESIYNEDTTIKYKEEKIEQEGMSGLKEVYYSVTYDAEGKEINRKLEKELIIVEATNEIIATNTTLKDGSKEDENFAPGFIILYLIVITVVVVNQKKDKNTTVIFKEIIRYEGLTKYVLYCIYFITVILPIVDVIFILHNKINKQ